jgi:hypothetical protein
MNGLMSQTTSSHPAGIKRFLFGLVVVESIIAAAILIICLPTQGISWFSPCGGCYICHHPAWDNLPEFISTTTQTFYVFSFQRWMNPNGYVYGYVKIIATFSCN